MASPLIGSCPCAVQEDCAVNVTAASGRLSAKSWCSAGLAGWWFCLASGRQPRGLAIPPERCAGCEVFPRITLAFCRLEVAGRQVVLRRTAAHLVASVALDWLSLLMASMGMAYL